MASKEKKLDPTVVRIIVHRIGELVTAHNDAFAKTNTRDRKAEKAAHVKALHAEVMKHPAKYITINDNDVLTFDTSALDQKVKRPKDEYSSYTEVVFPTLAYKHYGDIHPAKFRVFGDPSRFKELSRKLDDAVLAGDTTGLGAIIARFHQ